MKKYYILLLILICSPCFSCGDDGLNKRLQEGYTIVQQDESDLNDDNIRDKFVYLGRDHEAIIFMIIISGREGKCTLSVSTPEIEFGGCGGSCYIDSIYAKKGSVFIQRNSKSGDSITSLRYQFLYSKGDWKLAGYKTDQYFFPESGDSYIENKILDTNWLTGARNTTLKFSSRKSKTTSDKVAVKPMLFKDFQLEVEWDVLKI